MEFLRRLRTLFQCTWTTRGLSRGTFLFLGLGICVFAWGLQYKLSLYYPAESSYQRVPEAKLLSRDEQPRIASNLSLQDQKTPKQIPRFCLTALMLAWLTSMTFGLSLVARRRFSPRGHKPWLRAVQANLAALFFRPPPFFA